MQTFRIYVTYLLCCSASKAITFLFLNYQNLRSRAHLMDFLKMANDMHIEMK